MVPHNLLILHIASPAAILYSYRCPRHRSLIKNELKLVMLPPVARAAALQVLALICEVRPDSLASFLDLSHSTHIVPT